MEIAMAIGFADIGTMFSRSRQTWNTCGKIDIISYLKNQNRGRYIKQNEVKIQAERIFKIIGKVRKRTKDLHFRSDTIGKKVKFRNSFE
jgi:hypothetical protein